MKNTIYNQRLIKFAQHLALIKDRPKMGEYKYAILCSFMHGKQIEFGTCYHAWIFDDLPILFNEDWYFNGRLKEPFKKGMSEDEGSIGGVFDFFDLTPQEFCHLFDIDGLQNPYYYGGTFLNEESDGPQILKTYF